jgi:hypothetical protein
LHHYNRDVPTNQENFANNIITENTQGEPNNRFDVWLNNPFKPGNLTHDAAKFPEVRSGCALKEPMNIIPPPNIPQSEYNILGTTCAPSSITQQQASNQQQQSLMLNHGYNTLASTNGKYCLVKQPLLYDGIWHKNTVNMLPQPITSQDQAINPTQIYNNNTSTCQMNAWYLDPINRSLPGPISAAHIINHLTPRKDLIFNPSRNRADRVYCTDKYYHVSVGGPEKQIMIEDMFVSPDDCERQVKEGYFTKQNEDKNGRQNKFTVCKPDFQDITGFTYA